MAKALSFIHINAAFKMEIETAEVQIDSPDYGMDIIYQHGFGMKETGSILIDFYPAFNQGFVVGAGHGMDKPFIRVEGGYYPDIYPSFGS